MYDIIDCTEYILHNTIVQWKLVQSEGNCLEVVSINFTPYCLHEQKDYFLSYFEANNFSVDQCCYIKTLKCPLWYSHSKGQSFCVTLRVKYLHGIYSDISIQSMKHIRYLYQEIPLIFLVGMQDDFKLESLCSKMMMTTYRENILLAEIKYLHFRIYFMIQTEKGGITSWLSFVMVKYLFRIFGDMQWKIFFGINL